MSRNRAWGISRGSAFARCILRHSSRQANKSRPRFLSPYGLFTRFTGASTSPRAPRAAGKRLSRANRVGPFSDAMSDAVWGAFLRALSSPLMAPVLDFLDIAPDVDHRVTETIQFFSRFALSWLDHQGSRPPGKTSWAHGSHSPSGVSQYPRLSRPRLPAGADVDDALMRHHAVRPLVQNLIVGLEPIGHVIRVQNGTCVALTRPSPPIMAIYIQEMGNIPALPQGAAETASTPVSGPTPETTECFGK